MANRAMSGNVIRLRTYVDVLEEAAGGEIESLQHWQDAPLHRRAARELLRSGLLSDARFQIGTITSAEALVLTPEGALALVEWRDFLRERSLWMRAWRVFYQWLLVLVGAVAGGAAGVVATRLWPPG